MIGVPAEYHPFPVHINNSDAERRTLHTAEVHSRINMNTHISEYKPQ